MKRTRLVLVGAVLLAACAPGKHSAKAPLLAHDAPQSDKYVLVDNAWLRVRDTAPERIESRRHPVIMVHGYGSRLETWTLIQPALAESRRVVSYDQRGFGKSERPGGKYGPAVHARDLVALADALELEKPVLVGHSYGGGVVLKAALEHPERFAGLVLVDAFALEEQIPSSFRWAKVPGLGEFIFATQFKEVVGEKYILAFSDQQRFATPESIGEFRSNMVQEGALYAALHTVRGMDYTRDQKRYNTLRVPTVIVWGEDDRVTPLADGKKLAGYIDNTRLEVLTRCGHVPPWERPAALLNVIQELLAVVDGGAAPRARVSSGQGGVATP
ncbi:MAG: alpha/beta hydrolase [Myxococcota bacterium]